MKAVVINLVLVFFVLFIINTNYIRTADASSTTTIPTTNNNNTNNVKAAFDTKPFTPGVTHRQNVCSRYEAYHNGSIALADALNGFALHPIISITEFFPYYDNNHDDDDDEPGLMVTLLDMIAERAGFTWRDSFGVLEFPPPQGITYTDLLLWATETYDIAIDVWDRSAERVGLGVTYLEPFEDASLILIQMIDTSNEDEEAVVVLDNFLSPFTHQVWILIGATILVAGLTHQFIQYLEGEHDDRTKWEWFSDSLYLSSINFSQNYEYEFESCGGKVFGVGMTLWALLITATYTANLASLLVVQNAPPATIGSIEQAIVEKVKICTIAATQADEYIKQAYPSAIRKPKKDPKEAFEELREGGDCNLLVAQRDDWFTFKGDNRYNPDCNLEWVGRTVKEFKAGFAVKADAGIKCSSFIRDVLDYYMLQLINEGLVEVLKQRFREKAQASFPNECGSSSSSSSSSGGGGGGSSGGGSGGDDNRRRMLEWSNSLPLSEESDSTTATSSTTNYFATRWRQSKERELKAGASASQAAGSADSDDDSSDDDGNSNALTLSEMFGTFALLWTISLVAILISAMTTAYKYWNGNMGNYSHKYAEPGKSKNNNKKKDHDDDDERSSVKNNINKDDIDTRSIDSVAASPAVSASHKSSIVLGDSSRTQNNTILDTSHKSKSRTKKAVSSSSEVDFDWAGSYELMTDKEKQIADAIFGRILLSPRQDVNVGSDVSLGRVEEKEEKAPTMKALTLLGGSYGDDYQ